MTTSISSATLNTSNPDGAPISFSGLASGIDSSSLISSLVADAEAPAGLLQTQQQDLADKTQIVDGISTALGSLGTLIGGMQLDSEVQYRTSSASDSSVSIAVSGEAAVQTHDIRVQQLASAQVVSSNTFASDTAGIAGTGSVTIQTGSGTPQTVSWSASDTLDDIASAITSANAGVTASVLFDGTNYRIITTANSSGTANAATFTESGDALGLSNSANVTVPPANAILTVDGVTVTRPSNVIDDVLQGVTITANSVPASSAPDTQVSVSVDTSAIANQLQSFVSAYNGVSSLIQQQLAYTSATTTSAGQSNLFGDSTIEGLEGALANVATGYFGSSTLSNLGMTIDSNGTMSLNTTTLDNELAGNPNALQSLFVDGGLATSMANLVNGYTESGDGILSQQVSGYQTQTTDLQNQIDQIDTNGQTLQTQLQDEFNNLETTMSSLSDQSTYITKLLDSTTSSTSS